MEQASIDPSINSLPPLIHRTKSGGLLKRAPDVDQQIHECLALPIGELLNRAALEDAQRKGFIKEETLVYLIRAFHRAGNTEITNQLSEALIKRCASFIYSKFSGLNDPDDAYSAVIAEMFEQLLFRDDGRGDYFQVRFWRALKLLVITVFHSHVDETKDDQATFIAFSELAGEEHEKTDRNDLVPGFIPRTAIANPDLSTEETVLIRDAISKLEEPLRTAYILRYLLGLQIESNDPTEPTLSKTFDKDPRTIRNWLKHAEAILEEWRGENHE